MPKLQWSEHYETGLASIDRQHREFFRRLNALDDALGQGRPKEVIVDTITFLLDYIRVHFQEEEEQMRASGYPGFAEHQAAHRQLEERTQGLFAQYQAGARFMSTRLSRFIADWLVQHILKMDMAYVPHLQGHPRTCEVFKHRG